MSISEFFDALNARIRSPIFGYFLLALFALNWRPIFYLFIADGPASETLEFIDQNTSILSVLVFPLIIATLGSIIYPWINYVFLRISQKPTELRNILQAETENAVLTKKLELESKRSQLQALRETEVLEQAKRDIEAEGIDDEVHRTRVKEKLEEVRNKDPDAMEKFPEKDQRALGLLIGRATEREFNRYGYSDARAEALDKNTVVVVWTKANLNPSNIDTIHRSIVNTIDRGIRLEVRNPDTNRLIYTQG